jgi:hypothetical protein
MIDSQIDVRTNVPFSESSVTTNYGQFPPITIALLVQSEWPRPTGRLITGAPDRIGSDRLWAIFGPPAPRRCAMPPKTLTRFVEQMFS